MTAGNNVVSAVIDSESGSVQTREYSFSDNARLVLEITGNSELTLDLNITVSPDCRFSGVLINHNGAGVTLREHYSFGSDSRSALAYCYLNDRQCNIDSTYSIDGQGADLKVVSATLTSQRNSYNQQTVHNAPNSTAAVNNFGVVMQQGYCDYVVKNTIKEKVTGCTSTQASHLLTLDSESGGRIIPVLYIDNNDVKAGHAASMGQPDEDSLFYLQTRGLDHRQSLQLIASGYLKAVTAEVPDSEISEMLTREIEEKVIQCLK